MTSRTSTHPNIRFEAWSDATRDGWIKSFVPLAEAYWTPEREAQVASGKEILIKPRQGARLLRALGLLHRDASMPPKEVRKYRQINHMVAILRPSFAELMQKNPVVRILDAGCGRSYLTLLLAYCFQEVWKHPCEILGVDRNQALILECEKRTAQAGLSHLVKHQAIALEDLQVEDSFRTMFGHANNRALERESCKPHVLVSLHACDTATCDALAHAVRLKVDMIASVPCCQAELAKHFRSSTFPSTSSGSSSLGGALKHPHLQREMGAHLTDAMRALLLETQGYDVNVLEFVPLEHSAKNTLIRAMRRDVETNKARESYQRLVNESQGFEIKLAQLLKA